MKVYTNQDIPDRMANSSFSEEVIAYDEDESMHILSYSFLFSHWSYVDVRMEDLPDFPFVWMYRPKELEW